METDTVRPLARAPDDSVVRIRRVDARDAAPLEDFYASLSPESRYRRFLGTCRGLSPTTSRQLCTPDHVHAEGFVAVLHVSGPDEGRIVGHVCLVPALPDEMELGIAVGEGFERRGIGTRLVGAATSWAAAHGATAITATALATNTTVLRLLASARGETGSHAAADELVAVRIPLTSPPTSTDAGL